jgi:hypothetical protein
MKQILMVGVLALTSAFMTAVVSCTPKGNPVATTVRATSTPTATTTPMGPTPTPGTAAFPVLYNDGAVASVVTTFNSFDGNTNSSGSFPTLNTTDTTIGGYGGDYYGYLCEWTAGELSGFSGWAWGGYTGFSLAGNPMNFSAYTTCKFWAKANESVSVGFNAAELDSSDTGNVAEALTTTWTQFTLNIVPGSRSDGYNSGSTLAAISTYFVEVITALPGVEPLYVNIDQVTFQ